MVSYRIILSEATHNGTVHCLELSHKWKVNATEFIAIQAKPDAAAGGATPSPGSGSKGTGSGSGGKRKSGGGIAAMADRLRGRLGSGSQSSQMKKQRQG